MSVVIDVLGAEQAARERPGLVALLKDAVDSGASIGFLPPLGEAEGEAYWRGVVDAVGDGSCVLLGRARRMERSSGPRSSCWRLAPTDRTGPRSPR
jgi:hypothetical protein